MRLNVTQSERMIGNVAERLRLRLITAHEIGIFRMSRDVTSALGVARDRADQFGNVREFRMREIGEIRMTRIVAQQHGVTRNRAFRQVIRSQWP